MPNIENVRAYSELPGPLLTAYLDTNPAKDSNRRPVPEFRTWLNVEGKTVARELPPDQRKLFRQQLERLENFLRDRAVREHGMLVFAGSDTWKVVPLQQSIGNELHWGEPSVAQLLSLVEEHKPYGIVVVDRTTARFFRFRMGELTPLGEKSLEVDTSKWRKQDMGKFSSAREGNLGGAPGVKKSRGVQRDNFQRRLNAQYARSCSEIAENAVRIARARRLRVVFLIGPGRLVQKIAGAFPPAFSVPVVKIEKDLGGIELNHMERRVAPLISQWERAYESDLAAALLNGSQGTIVGMDETLVELQRGRVRNLVVARDMPAILHRCVRCGWAERPGPGNCPLCGGERRNVALREVLPELAWKHKTEIQIVSGEAAERLRGAEGIGAWLRRPKEILAINAFKQAG